jgi:DNA-binding MarR family transcriptional regulator
MAVSTVSAASSKAPRRVAADAADATYQLEMQVGFVLRRAHQRHVAIFTECMDELGLTPTQFSALAKINDEGSVSQGRLGRLTSMDPANILGVVQRLTQRGLVSRRPDPDDARSTLLTLTTSGRDLLAQAIGRAQEATERTLRPLPAAKRKALLQLLAKIAE